MEPLASLRRCSKAVLSLSAALQVEKESQHVISSFYGPASRASGWYFRKGTRTLEHQTEKALEGYLGNLIFVFRKAEAPIERDLSPHPVTIQWPDRLAASWNGSRVQRNKTQHPGNRRPSWQFHTDIDTWPLATGKIKLWKGIKNSIKYIALKKNTHS